VVSLHASKCLTDSTPSTGSFSNESLAEAKLEVDALDKLPGAIDDLAASMRRRLGESRASIARLDKPLLSANTGSLDALKAYSQGHRLAEEGKRREALPLLQHAVELDPGFATAYLDLSTTYYGLLDDDHARAALSKAYALRENAPESATLLIRLPDNATEPDPARRDWVRGGNIAYSKICTHAGCPVAIYRERSLELYCPCHQSIFDVVHGGTPVSGPATRALPQLALDVDADGYLIARGDFSEPVGPDRWDRAV